MVEIKFVKTVVSVYVEGKLFSKYSLNKQTYNKLFNDLQDSTYPTYSVYHFGREIFSGTDWKSASKFLASFCGA